MVEQNFKEITLDREICKHFGIFIKKSRKVAVQHFANHSVEITIIYSHNLYQKLSVILFILTIDYINYKIQIDFTKF